MYAGEQQQFSAQAFDQYGNEITGLNFTWSATGGVINQDGLYTAGDVEGTFSVIAALGNASGSTTIMIGNPAEVVWVEDTLPGGAVSVGVWNWTSSDPAPFSGSLAHKSALASGFHQHYFSGATETLQVNAGDTLFAYVYLDPSDTPAEVMLQWNAGSNWEHRAYWGANNTNGGVDGTASRYYMGDLPTAGEWVQLEVPAGLVGLEGSTLSGMAFTLYDGRATWDHAGKSIITSSTTFYTTTVANGQSDFTGAGINVVSRNNIYHTGRYVIEIRSGTDSGNSYDHNNMFTIHPTRFVKWYDLIYTTLLIFQNVTGQELHAISSDSQFVDPNNGVFILQATSPCVDGGVVIPNFNYANSLWPFVGTAPDMGAFEYGME